MANIMINKVCNLNCSYCFANEFVNKIDSDVNLRNKNNISIENFKKAIEFVLTEKGERIGIIGGEPTLHPQFKELMEILINDDRVKSVNLFTNGVFLDKYFDILSSPKFSMLINLNSPKEIGEKAYEKTLRNLDVLIKERYMGNRIGLGINMHKEDFDYKYMIKALKRYNFKSVRTSIVVPNIDDERNSDPVEYFKRMKPHVFKFFRELEFNGIMPTYDCNLMPACVTTQEEKEWLRSFYRFEKSAKKYCNLVDNSKCGVVLDILSDLSAVRCFGMSREEKVYIKDFRNVREIRGYFMNNFDNFAYRVPSSEVCRTCKLRLNGSCMGGCLAFKAEKIKKITNICDSF